ncbi:MAG: TIGR01777 family oxidoreductase [Verrucomicrobia bacterium]|nr:TIGR01777 family oxidoreductase [Verrucomicrobiota bacterium]NDE63218.1 TIGR01777 family protein [Chlamydiota bacterium]
MKSLSLRTLVPFSVKEVELRHLDPEAVFRWVMANERLSVSELLPAQNGQRLIRFRLKHWLRPLVSYMRVHFDPSNLFRVKQDKGIFKHFEYCVSCHKEGDQTLILDEIQFELTARWFFYRKRVKKVEKVLERIIKDKNEMIRQELELMKRYPSHKPLKILLFGSHGFIGHALDLMLSSFGHRIFRAVRSKTQLTANNTVLFNDESGEADRDNFENFDAFINLAGANIAEKRWTESRKSLLYQSRVQYTQKLSKLILSLERPPKTLISTSAVGFYGPVVEMADEGTPKGEGFLSDLSHDWEKAATLVGHRNCRLVILRFGVVLGQGGGMLDVFQKLAHLWLLGPVGDGLQKNAWVSHRDVLGAIYHFLISSAHHGTFNLVANDHPTQKKIAELVMQSIHGNNRWFNPLPVPRWWVELLFGKQMAKELFFASQVVSNKKLIHSGYRLFYPFIQNLITPL